MVLSTKYTISAPNQLLGVLTYSACTFIQKVKAYNNIFVAEKSFLKWKISWEICILEVKTTFLL